MGAAQTLRALIGGFDLDPNRVLDIVLESLERDCGSSSEVIEAHLNLAQQLSLNESFPHILGFKFQHYHKQSATPRSLCRLAVMLLSANVISIEALLPHLAPSLGTLADDAKQFGEQTDKEAGCFGVISLGGSGEKSDLGMQRSRIHAASKVHEDSNDVSTQIFGIVEALLWDQPPGLKSGDSQTRACGLVCANQTPSKILEGVVAAVLALWPSCRRGSLLEWFTINII